MEKVLKIIALAAFVIFIAASTAIDGTPKFGYLNSALILSELPEVKAANADLEVLESQLQKKGQKMATDLEAKYKAAAQKQQAGQLSPAQAQEEEQQINKGREDLVKYEQEMRQQLAEKQQELIGPITERLNDALKAVGDEGGYTMVFDLSVAAGVVVYVDEAIDITEAVKAKL